MFRVYVTLVLTLDPSRGRDSDSLITLEECLTPGIPLPTTLSLQTPTCRSPPPVGVTDLEESSILYPVPQSSRTRRPLSGSRDPLVEPLRLVFLPTLRCSSSSLPSLPRLLRLCWGEVCDNRHPVNSREDQQSVRFRRSPGQIPCLSMV